MLLLPMHATQTQDSETQTEREERENILPIQNRLSDFGSGTETAWPWRPRSAYVMNLASAILVLSTWIKLNQLIRKLPSKFPSHQYEWRFHPRRVSQPAMPDMRSMSTFQNLQTHTSLIMLIHCLHASGFGEIIEWYGYNFPCERGLFIACVSELWWETRLWVIH